MKESYKYIINLLPESLRTSLILVFSKFTVLNIRIRVNKPLCISVLHENKATNLYIDNYGIASSLAGYIITKQDLTTTLDIITKNSLQTYEDQIMQGFISLPYGHRLGLSGELVNTGNNHTIKEFTSLNLRVSHEVKHCSYDIINTFNYKNTLLLSPPNCGKTTILRDITYQLSEQGYNVLVIDERNEISATINGIPQYDIGINTDVLVFGDKLSSITRGIRSLSPDWIIVDELGGETDYMALHHALTLGIKIVASAHANSINDLQNKSNFIDILKNKLFDNYYLITGINEQIKKL